MPDPLVLSLFPGIGLLDMAFEQEGFCVVRGPDLLWGGDIKRFHPPAGKFDGVIGGPPCQAFSSLAFLVKAVHGKVAENLIPEYERCVHEAQPDWFLMENVPRAPIPVIPGLAVESFIINNRWFGSEQNRVRRFSFGSCGLSIKRYLEFEAFDSPHYARAVLACEMTGGKGTPPTGTRRIGARIEKGRSFEEMVRLQGLPEGFSLPFTREWKSKAVGNGVPLPMGRAIAKAVRKALETHALP